MTFRVRIDPVASRQIEDFAAYLSDCDEDFALEQIDRLDRIYFAFTGAPHGGRGPRPPPNVTERF
jgi:hypothetical protein